MVALTGREKAGMADVDVVIGWCRLLLKRWWSRGREKIDMTYSRERKLIWRV
jgi:hypothetical protein